MAASSVLIKRTAARVLGGDVGLVVTGVALVLALYWSARAQQIAFVGALLSAGVVLVLTRPRVAAILVMLLWAGPLAVELQIYQVAWVPFGAADSVLWLGLGGLALASLGRRLRPPRQRDLFAAPISVFVCVVLFAAVRGIWSGNAVGTAADAVMSTMPILCYFLFTRAYRGRLGTVVLDVVAVCTVTNLMVIAGVMAGVSKQLGTVVESFYTRGMMDPTLRIDAPAQRLASLAIMLIVVGLPHAPRRYRKLAWASLIIMVTSVFLTMTRSTWLPLLLMAIVAPALVSHAGAVGLLVRRLVIVSVCAGLLGGAAYTGALGSFGQSVTVRFASAADSNVAQDDSYQQRVVEDVAASERISEEPILGIGFPRAYGAYVPYYQPYTNLRAFFPRYFIHNSYLGVMMWMGLPGIASLLFLAWRVLTAFRLAVGAGRVDRRVPLAAAGTLFVLATSSSFQTNLMFRPYYLVMAVTLAVLQLWWERREHFTAMTDVRPMRRQRWKVIGGRPRPRPAAPTGLPPDTTPTELNAGPAESAIADTEGPMAPRRGGGVLRGASMLMASRLVGLVVTLIQLKLVTTYLGPAGYGLLATAILLVGTFEGFAEVGVGQIVVRRVARGADLTHTVGLAQAWSLLFMGPLTLAAMLAAVALYRGDSQVLLSCLVLSMGLGFTAYGMAFQPVAQLTDRFGGVSLADFVGRLASFGIVLVGLSVQGPLLWFVVAQLAAPVMRCLVLWGWARGVGRFRPRFRMSEVLGLAKEALPLTYIMVLSGLYLQLDGLLLTKLSDPVDVGAYNLAFRIVANVNMIAMALVAVLNARFAIAAARGDTYFGQVLGTASRVILALCLPIGLLMSPFSADLIGLLGSAEFVPISTTPLTLLWVAIGISMATTVISSALIAGHAQKFLAVLNTLTLLANLALNIALIPRYGAVGAAIALICTEAIGFTGAMIMLVRRLPSFIPWRLAGLAIIALLVALGVESLIGNLYWVLRGIVVTAVYFGLIYGFGVVRKSTLTELSAAGD